jgi:acetolactate synthase-1/2/3 large subunit
MTKLTAGEVIYNHEGQAYGTFSVCRAVTPSLYVLYKTDGIEHVLVRHEQSAANMAAAYAQLTGGPGVCIVTAGPGATNLVTGIAEAFIGSLPVVVFAARGGTRTSQKSEPEVSTEKIFAPITKWSGSRRPSGCDSRDRAPRIHDARGGKPGPVYVDLPRDLLPQDVEFDDYYPTVARGAIAGDPDLVRSAAEALLTSKRPILIAGGGAVMSGA